MRRTVDPGGAGDGDRHDQPRDRTGGEDLRPHLGRRAGLPHRESSGGVRSVPHHRLQSEGRMDERRRRHPRRGTRRRRRPDDHRDGQDPRRRPRRGREVRESLPLLRRPCRGVPRRRGRRPFGGARPAGVRALPAARTGAGRHALELPALAGDPLRRARPDGGQRRSAQALLERAANGSLPGGPVPSGRLPSRHLPDSAHRLRHRGEGTARPPRARRHPHGKRARGQVGGRDRRQ